MSEEFDKILSQKIKDSIETNKVSYNPEHWKLLKKKQHKKKRRALIWWRVAAILVIGTLIGTFISYLINPAGVQLIEENKVVDTKSINDSLNPIIKNNNLNVAEGDSHKLKANQENKNTATRNFTEHSNNKFAQQVNPTQDVKSKSISRNIEVYFAKNDFRLLMDNSKIAINESFTDNFNLLRTKLESKSKMNDLEELMALEETNEEEGIDKNIIQMGILVSSMTNIDNQYSNESAGFSSGLALEIPVLKNIEIYTGAVYSNQNFNVFNQNLNLIDGVSAKGNNVVLKSRVTSVQSIEIPINIKYNFELNSKKLFVSAGISPTQYFNEEIEATYLVNNRLKTEGEDEFGNNYTQYELTQNESVADTKIDSNKFELFSMVNFSVGMAIPMNSGKQELIIEPFFKQSLSSLTSQKVNFSNAGVQLRYNFSIKK